MNKLLTIGIAYCVVLTACNKKEYEIDNPTYGKTSVEINGEKWKEDVKSATLHGNNRFSFAAFKYREISGVHIVFEILSFDYLHKNQNKQTINDRVRGQQINPDSLFLFARFSTTQDDGDVSCDGFQILESDSANNWIQITKEKDNYKEIWGFYSATFVRQYGCAASPYTDTLRFRNGNFHFRFE